jgi:hypothetical protein
MNVGSLLQRGLSLRGASSLSGLGEMCPAGGERERVCESAVHNYGSV